MVMSKRSIRRILNRVACYDLPYRSVPKDYDVVKNVNTGYCSTCKGECCKRCGCEFSPDDFEDLSYEGLKKKIEKGYISIECIRGDEIERRNDALYLRVRNLGSPIVDYALRKKRCILLTDKGCKLGYEERPAGGKLLIPTIQTDGLIFRSRCCKSSYSIEACCYEWAPHQRTLLELAWYFLDKDYPCSI